MTGFRIPVARTAGGRLVAPAHADKSAIYTCPSCDGRVDLHAGEKKRRHFHHRAGACSSETVLHLSAKRLIVDAVDAWLAGDADAPVFVRRCAHPGCEATTRQPMPRKVGRAAEEHRLPSGHVGDVVLLARAADLPIAVIEVLHTHAVDEEKAFELGVPWVEVDAEQICADGGGILVAVRDRLLSWLCRDHATTRGEAHAQARVDRERLAVLARRLDYRLADFPAYRVERLVTCENGHDAIVFAWDGPSPPDPRPPHVVAAERADLDATYQPSAKSWKKLLPYKRVFVSVCPACGAQLGSS